MAKPQENPELVPNGPIAKIVSKEEAYWTDCKTQVENQIEGLKKALKLNEVILDAILIKLKEAQAGA